MIPQIEALQLALRCCDHPQKGSFCDLLGLIQPFRCLSLYSEGVCFSKSLQDLHLVVQNLQILSGRIVGSRNASRELTIEHLTASVKFSDAATDTFLFLRGVFVGFVSDSNESAFMRQTASTLRSIFIAHRWILPSSSPSAIEQPAGKAAEYSTHSVIHLETSSIQQGSVS